MAVSSQDFLKQTVSTFLRKTQLPSEVDNGKLQLSRLSDKGIIGESSERSARVSFYCKLMNLCKILSYKLIKIEKFVDDVCLNFF